MTAGQSRYSYRLRATDPNGASRVRATRSRSPRARPGRSLSAVRRRSALADGPQSYWAFERARGQQHRGRTCAAGENGATRSAGVTVGDSRRDPRSIQGPPTGYVRDRRHQLRCRRRDRNGRASPALSAWKRGSSPPPTAGGKIIGCGHRSRPATPRQLRPDDLYLEPRRAGSTLGVNPDAYETIGSTTSYNDGPVAPRGGDAG